MLYQTITHFACWSMLLIMSFWEHGSHKWGGDKSIKEERTRPRRVGEEGKERKTMFEQVLKQIQTSEQTREQICATKIDHQRTPSVFWSSNSLTYNSPTDNFICSSQARKANRSTHQTIQFLDFASHNKKRKSPTKKYTRNISLNGHPSSQVPVDSKDWWHNSRKQ